MDVADAAYRDVLVAVLKSYTRCPAATGPKSGAPNTTGPKAHKKSNSKLSTEFENRRGNHDR